MWNHAKNRERKGSGGEELEEVWSALDHGTEQFTELDRMSNVIFQPLHAVSPHHKPDFQRPEPPSQRNLPVPVISDETRIRKFVPQIRWRNRQRIN